MNEIRASKRAFLTGAAGAASAAAVLFVPKMAKGDAPVYAGPVFASPDTVSLVNTYGAVAASSQASAVDVTQALINAIQDTSRPNSIVTIPGGNYLIAPAGASAGGAYATFSTGKRFLCDPDAYFFTNGAGLDHDMIRFSAPSGGLSGQNVELIWEGGTIDQTNQKNSTSMPYTTTYPGGAPNGVGNSSTCDGISIRGGYVAPTWSSSVTYSANRWVTGSDGNAYLSLVNGNLNNNPVGGTGAYWENLGAALTYQGSLFKARVYGVQFISGAHWNVAGGDSNIYCGDGTQNIDIDCTHFGSRDTAVYCSTNSPGTTITGSGSCATIRGSYWNCFYGQAFKRGWIDFASSGYYYNCVGGVLAVHVSGPQALGGRITGTFSQCLQAVRLDYSQGVTVDGVYVVNQGALLQDDATIISNTVGQPLGVVLNGCVECGVINSHFDGYTTGYTKSNTSGVQLNQLVDSIAGTISCNYNLIRDNVVNGLHTIGAETTGGADYNRWECNRILNGDLPGATLTGAHSSEIRYNETALAWDFRNGAIFPAGSLTQAALAAESDITTGINMSAPGTITMLSSGTAALTVGTAVVISRQIEAPVASAAAPAYCFSADATTGLYRAGTAKAGLSAGGVGAFVAGVSNSVAYLQIGTTTGPTIAIGSGAPSGSTFNGVPGAAAGTPATGSQYTNTSGASGARVYFYFGGAWVAQSTP